MWRLFSEKYKYTFDFVGGKDNSVAIGAGLAVGLTAVGVTAIIAIAVIVYFRRKKQRPLPPTPAVAGIARTYIYTITHTFSLTFLYTQENLLLIP